MHVGIANPRWWGKRSWNSQHMRNPQFCESGKRPMEGWSCIEKGPVWLSAMEHWHFKVHVVPSGPRIGGFHIFKLFHFVIFYLFYVVHFTWFFGLPLGGCMGFDDILLIPFHEFFLCLRIRSRVAKLICTWHCSLELCGLKAHAKMESMGRCKRDVIPLSLR